MGDSDDDLLESSEEEDEDEVNPPHRMPDPRASESAGLTGPSAFGSRTRSGLSLDVSPNPPVKSSGLVDDSHIQTRSGVRPSVAFQMKEMEGRPSEEDHDGLGADGREQDGGRESKASSGSAENLVREYMVSGVEPGGLARRLSRGAVFFIGLKHDMLALRHVWLLLMTEHWRSALTVKYMFFAATGPPSETYRLLNDICLFVVF